MAQLCREDQRALVLKLKAEFETFVMVNDIASMKSLARTANEFDEQPTFLFDQPGPRQQKPQAFPQAVCQPAMQQNFQGPAVPLAMV